MSRHWRRCHSRSGQLEPSAHSGVSLSSPPARPSTDRSYTLVFSVIAHIAVVAAVYIAPAFATDELPEPPRTTSFIIVKPVMPDPPPLRGKREVPAPSRDAAPLEPPDGVRPEPTVEPADPTPAGDPGAIVTGVPFGEIASTGTLSGPEPPPQRPKEPVRVGSVIQPPKKVVHVAPVYPALALAARKEGVVILEAVLDEAGGVRDVRVLRSETLLDQAAIDAVRQWRFTPTLLNGQPVPVVMTVTVAFNLQR